MSYSDDETTGRPSQPDAALRANPEATARRLEALRDYMDANVLNTEGFRCSSYEVCRSSVKPGIEFYEGTLSHLGLHYDLELNGRPLRIVVVGQESAGNKRRVSLEERYAAIHDRSGLTARYYATDGHPPRNPHMRGTTSALRVLLGNGIGSDHDQEFIATADGERFHIFDAFALVNVLLCGAHPPGSAQGRGTKVMKRNCLRHFAATMEVLQPTLLVLQGEGVQAWIAAALGMMQDLSPHLSEARIAGGRALVCRFSHPSAPDRRIRWGDRLDAPYLRTVVEPTLELARASL